MDSRTTGALLGMIAGDAYVSVRQKTKSGKYPYTSSEMRVVHGSQQRAYCEFKCDLANRLLNRNSTVRRGKNGPGRRYDAYSFSVSHPYFKVLHRWCYPYGKKTFNQVWLDHITPEGIALWYMDGGHARRNINTKGRVSSVATSIATCCTDAEADLICKWFSDVHKIRFTTFPEGGGRSLRANTENSRLFAHLVQPYVIEPMLYKLTHVADLNSHECRAPVASCASPDCQNPIFDLRRKGLCSACYSRRYYRQVRKKRVMR